MLKLLWKLLILTDTGFTHLYNVPPPFAKEWPGTKGKTFGEKQGLIEYGQPARKKQQQRAGRRVQSAFIAARKKKNGRHG